MEGAKICSLVEREVTRPTSDAANAARQAASEAPPPSDRWTLPPLDVTPVQRLPLQDPEAWLSHLSDHGYVVIEQVLDQADLAKAHDLLWIFLEAHTGWGWKRHQEDTWYPISNLFRRWGILKCDGIGQCDAAWFCRTHPNVLTAFRQIWGEAALISAFDGLNVFLPWRDGEEQFKTQDGEAWLHSDQGRARDGLVAVQSFVALTDQDGTTGGLRVIPDSHHLHRDWVTDDYPGLHNFCMLHACEDRLRNPLRGLRQQLVTCKAGDLVLWDSRLIHCNTPAVFPPTPVPGELLRVAIYVCHIPKSQATDEQLRVRREAYSAGLSCNHYPLFDEDDIPDNNGAKYQPPSLEEARDGRKELVG